MNEFITGASLALNIICLSIAFFAQYVKRELDDNCVCEIDNIIELKIWK